MPSDGSARGRALEEIRNKNKRARESKPALPFEAQVEQDLFEASDTLEQSDRYDRTLDFKILVGLYWIEFRFMQIAKSGETPLNEDAEEALRADLWDSEKLREGLTTSEHGGRILKLLNKLGLVAESQENRDTFTKEYIVRNRRGLGVIPFQQLQQYRSYLKGFYFHAKGEH